MIQFKLKELIAKKEFDERRHIMVKEVCEATGIHRASLNKMLNHKPHNIGCEIIDLLCQYFGCGVADLMEHVPQAKQIARKSRRGKDRVPKAKAKLGKSNSKK